jgi:hypothetical protein
MIPEASKPNEMGSIAMLKPSGKDSVLVSMLAVLGTTLQAWTLTRTSLGPGVGFSALPILRGLALSGPVNHATLI